MPRGDMAHLVAEDGGELRVVGHDPQHAREHAHLAARQGERVDRLTVECHEHPVGPIGAAGSDKALTDAGDAPLKAGVAHGRSALEDFGEGARTKLGRHGLGHEEIGEPIRHRRITAGKRQRGGPGQQRAASQPAAAAAGQHLRNSVAGHAERAAGRRLQPARARGSDRRPRPGRWRRHLAVPGRGGRSRC